MATSFNNLLKTLPPERRDRIDARAQEMLLEMALQDLRQKRHLTQQQLAERLNLQQAAVSKMEGQSDMHVGTLQRIIRNGWEAETGGRIPR